MKIREIAWTDVSRYRGELMGAAILFIILFHIPLPRSDTFFGLHRCGNIGVDMFLFLSGVGLWYSWVKNPSTSHFYKRRLLRIFPTWLVISSIYYLQRFDFETGDYLDLLLDITVNWGFWLNDELAFCALSLGTALYEAHPAASLVSLAASADGLLVCHRAMGRACASGCGAYRNLLEPRTYLFYRHQLRRTR